MKVHDIVARETMRCHFRDRRQERRRESSKQPESMVGVTMSLLLLFSKDDPGFGDATGQPANTAKKSR